MRRKINVQLISISIIAIISTMLVMLFVFYDLFQTQVQDDLSANAIVLKNTGNGVKSYDREKRHESIN